MLFAGTSARTRDNARASGRTRGNAGESRGNNRRCCHSRTRLVDIGSAHVCESTECVECDKDVTPCVRCLCYITRNNFRRHRSNCLGSRFELKLTVYRSRDRTGGKFCKKAKQRQKRMPGRGSTKELFDEDKFVLVNNVARR